MGTAVRQCARDYFRAIRAPRGERILAGEILHRARQKSISPEPASVSGLALIDMFLKDFIDPIEPVLANQSDLLEVAVQ